MCLITDGWVENSEDSVPTLYYALAELGTQYLLKPDSK